MNILFYSIVGISPNKGGTERATYRLAKFLHCRHGHNCYSIYSTTDKTINSDAFCHSLYLPMEKIASNEFRNYVINNKIDIVINQSGSFGVQKPIRNALRGLKCKYVVVHHFEPGWYKKTLEAISFQEIYRKASSLSKFMTPFLYMEKLMLCRYRVFRNSRSYYNDYKESDAVVLLSTNAIQQYKKYAFIHRDEKFHVIHNMLSFNKYATDEDILRKKKNVIVVSRLEEKTKRISLALKAWQLIKRDPISDGWSLTIIGEGIDRNNYERIAEDMNLEDYSFTGHQEPISFYKEASIFLMTSRSEGWGLTITESQQFGVVPVCFDSFSSLNDIVINGNNGFIVPDNDMKEYANKTLKIMGDDTLRFQMAHNSVLSSRRFEEGKIGNDWNDLLNNI